MKIGAGRVILGVLVIFAMWTCSTRERLHHNYDRVTGVFKVEMRTPKITFNPTKQKTIRKWRLDIPYIYISKWTGHNKNQEDQYFRMNLKAIYDPETSKILPYATARERYASNIDNKIRISIRSGGGAKGLGAGQCMPLYDYRASRSPNQRKRECPEHHRLCQVKMQLDGWHTSFSVDRKFYRNPQPVCDAVKALLDSMTIHRDGLFDEHEVYE